MARVTEFEVRDIFDSSRESLTSFVSTASLFVTENLVGKGLSDERLKVIELYLAAHFAAITDEGGGLIKVEAGGTRDTLADIYQGGLLSTRYGQQAVALDTTGTLGQIAKAAAAPTLNAEFRVV